MTSPAAGVGEISSVPGARVPTSSLKPRKPLRRSLPSSAPSTPEPIQAPEFAMGVWFPIEENSTGDEEVEEMREA